MPREGDHVFSGTLLLVHNPLVTSCFQDQRRAMEGRNGGRPFGPNSNKVR